MIDCTGRIRVPGLIDTHLRIESSVVTPQESGRCAGPRGVTTAICDPHEIENACGLTGIRYFPDASAETAMDKRHGVNGNLATGFVKGFGLARRAIAPTACQNHHNIAVVGATPDDMGLAVTRLGQIEGGRAAGTSDLFGGRAALAIFRIDTTTVREAAQDVPDFGVAVSAADTAQIERTNDAIARLSLNWLGLTNCLTAAVAPALETVANALADMGRGTGPISGALMGPDCPHPTRHPPSRRDMKTPGQIGIGP